MLESADDGYNQTRQIWNASVNKHPRLIAQCSGVADVIAAINLDARTSYWQPFVVAVTMSAAVHSATTAWLSTFPECDRST